MRPQLLFRKIHRWLGLILGLQILLWFLSGFFMSWMPIEQVRGSHLWQPAQSSPLPAVTIDGAKVQAAIPESVQSMVVKTWLQRPVIEATTAHGTWLLDAQNHALITPLNEQQARAVVAERLRPPLQILAVQWLDEVPAEARGRQAPLWQVQLSGPENPRVYVSPSTGDIVATRTDRWRWFDFLWMLHIMDYDEREDFNHPLLYLTAGSALLFTLSGVVLLVFSFRNRQRRRQATS
ncbi:PepSY domain-containing protein [Marinicella meishanensis]|uniref:PepSY domain-containing protein n=1 Tax=Marinicella meishanensis TaxID=2873263 RepID=UPI001CBEDBFD|nr:PepSY domain-containing protein [Marinicella sp. NBU2979]